MPRGLWFDEDKKRWRVRLYRNGKAYLPSPRAFFESRYEAEAAYISLRKQLDKMPKRPRVRADTVGKVDLATLWAQCNAANARLHVELVIKASDVA